MKPAACREFNSVQFLEGPPTVTHSRFASNVPGIWNEAQISAWTVVTERVHAKGGFIYLQLWALGRAAYPTVLAAKGLKYVSAGDIPTPVLEGELGPAPTPLSKDDIDRYVEAYGQAAKNAVHLAGFDGVEVSSISICHLHITLSSDDCIPKKSVTWLTVIGCLMSFLENS